jgi:hypothetical protein
VDRLYQRCLAIAALPPQPASSPSTSSSSSDGADAEGEETAAGAEPRGGRRHTQSSRPPVTEWQFRKGDAWERRFAAQAPPPSSSSSSSSSPAVTPPAAFDEWYVEAGGPHWAALMRYLRRRICWLGTGVRDGVHPQDQAISSPATDNSAVAGSSLQASSLVIQIGCGNSRLAEALHDMMMPSSCPSASRDGTHSGSSASQAAPTSLPLLNVDLSATVIRQMREKYHDTRPHLRFVQGDCLRLVEMLGESSVDVIVDKGTLHSILLVS